MRKKRMTKRVISTVLSAVLMFVPPLTYAEPAKAADKTLYISEFQVGMGETEAEAKKELEAGGIPY